MHGNLFDLGLADNPIAGSTRRYALVAVPFLNFPLGRHGKTHAHFKLDRVGGHCNLPGEPRVQLQFPRGADMRCPTHADMLVLFELTRFILLQRSNTITFPSLTKLLVEIRHDAGARDREAIKRTLRLWSELSVLFDRWYFPAHKRRKGRTGELLLPPALRDVQVKRRGVRIEFNDEWVTHWFAFWRYVPLDTLPTGAGQNLTLKLLGAPRYDKRFSYDDDTPGHVRRHTITLARQCGLTHNNWHGRWDRAVDEMQHYFDVNGGMVDCEQDNKHTDFYINQEITHA